MSTMPDQSRRDQPPLALAATVLRVPLSRFTPRVGGGSAFYVRRAMFTMSKARKIKEQIEVLDQHLAAANEYVARNVNVRGTASWLHLGDWKGKSGHPLWMKNHMIPSTQKSQAGKVRALEKIATKAKEKLLKKRKRKDADA